MRCFAGITLVLFFADPFLTAGGSVCFAVCSYARASAAKLSGRTGAQTAAGILMGALAAGALAGCSLSEGVGTYMIDPARYSAYHCKDLVDRLKELHDRQKELRNLIDKASEGGGGTVIATLAYRADYEKALGEEKLLRRTAAEKKCELEPPVYQSDQIVR